VTVDINNESGAPIDEHELLSLSKYVLAEMGIHPQAYLSIALVGVDAMEALHVRYMDEPGPTDVLAFPQDELRSPNDDSEPEPGILGDVIICPAVAATQAVEHHHSTADEVHLLCTHGILHLLGYDHAEPEEEREMFGLQDTLLAGWRASRPEAARP
jgi:probable rRNA maturation factor